MERNNSKENSKQTIDLGLGSLLSKGQPEQLKKQVPEEELAIVQSEDTVADMTLIELFRAGEFTSLIDRSEEIMRSDSDQQIGRCWWVLGNLKTKTLPMIMLAAPLESLVQAYLDQKKPRKEFFEALNLTLREFTVEAKKNANSSGDFRILDLANSLLKKAGIEAELTDSSDEPIVNSEVAFSSTSSSSLVKNTGKRKGLVLTFVSGALVLTGVSLYFLDLNGIRMPGSNLELKNEEGIVVASSYQVTASMPEINLPSLKPVKVEENRISEVLNHLNSSVQGSLDSSLNDATSSNVSVDQDQNSKKLVQKANLRVNTRGPIEPSNLLEQVRENNASGGNGNSVSRDSMSNTVQPSESGVSTVKNIFVEFDGNASLASNSGSLVKTYRSGVYRVLRDTVVKETARKNSPAVAALLEGDEVFVEAGPIGSWLRIVSKYDNPGYVMMSDVSREPVKTN